MAKKIILIFVACISGFLFGYDLGVISGAVVLLKHELNWGSVEQELFVSSLLIGAVVGSPVGGWFSDRFGRKKAIIASSGLYLTGALAFIFSPALVSVLSVCRGVIGLGVGFGSSCVVVFLAEHADSDSRGAIVALNEFSVTVGILVSYVVDWSLSQQPQGWRWMIVASALPAAGQAISMFFLPETTRWLTLKQQRSAITTTTLESTMHNEIPLTELIVESSADEEPIPPLLKQSQRYDNNQRLQQQPFCSRPILYPCFVAIMLVVFQQACGQSAVLYYNGLILEAVAGGLESSVIPAALKMVATIAAVLLIDRVGRRKLLLSGTVVMLVSLISLAVNSATLSSTWVSVTFLSLFLVGYSISFGPVTWVLLSELFPARFRSQCAGLTTSVNWIMSLVVSLSFLSFVESTSYSGVFVAYASAVFLSILFIFVFVKETNRHSLEEIERSIAIASS